MRSSVQETMLHSLHGILRPVIRLLLLCGLGYNEFTSITKQVFVQVATEQYGIRGRPTNISRVAAMTGLSRKQVSKIRSDERSHKWTPDMEASPVNTVLHFWNFDPEFAHAPGKPKALRLEGPSSFTALVKKYGGDIPPGALRAELCRNGVAMESVDRELELVKRFYLPINFHDDFVRNIAFAMRNLGNTLVHNAELAQGSGTSEEINVLHGRFERSAFTQRLTERSIREFQLWVRTHGAKFIEDADHWIGRNELPQREWSESDAQKICGIGVYFFVDESQK